MQVAILAGGQATRLRPLTDSIPKSMVEIEGRPFIEFQIELLRKSGVTNAVLCVGYLGGQIESYLGDGQRYGIKLQYSYEKEQLLGTAGALKNAEHMLHNQFFVMYGDSYLSLDLHAIAARFNQHTKSGLMVVYQNYNHYDKSNIVVEGDLVKLYSKDHITKEMTYIDYGASILTKKTLQHVPVGTPYSLEDLLTPLVDRGDILAYEVHERFYEIGTQQSLEEFKNYIGGLDH